jgi:hypothetical protein
MSEVVKIIKSEDYGVEENKFNDMQKGLQLTLNERDLLREEFEVVSKLEVTEENKAKFRDLRLKWAKNRTKGVNDWHKKGKAVSLAIGKLYDARKNELNREGEANELVLFEAENHLENLEKERLETLRVERAELLSEYVDDAYERVLNNMEPDVWEAYLATKKQAHLDLVQAEKDAEIERQRLVDEQEAEKKRIKLENARLLEEANQRAKLAEEKVALQLAKQKKIDAENLRIQKEIDEKKIAEQEKIDADNLAKQKVIDDKRIAQEKLAEIDRVAKQKVIDDRIAKEKIESDRIKNELEAKKQAELDITIINELALQHELKKGDAEKVLDLIKSLESIKTKFTFKSKLCVKMFEDVSGLLDKVIVFIEK